MEETVPSNHEETTHVDHNQYDDPLPSNHETTHVDHKLDDLLPSAMLITASLMTLYLVTMKKHNQLSTLYPVTIPCRSQQVG